MAFRVLSARGLISSRPARPVAGLRIGLPAPFFQNLHPETRTATEAASVSPAATAETFDLSGPILEIGSYQVVPGEGNLRPLFPSRDYVGLDRTSLHRRRAAPRQARLLGVLAEHRQLVVGSRHEN